MIPRRSWFCALLALAAAATVLPREAQAQAYPNRPVRLIVPFAAGGAVDVLARLLAGKLSDHMGQPFIVENRAGAGGTLAADQVAKSPPDGYTILQNTSGAAIAPALYKTMPFDPYKDLATVTQITGSTLVLVAAPNADIRSIPDLIARAREKPGKLNYGSSGVGNPLHLTMEMLKHETGIDIMAVPFRGDAQSHAALPDVPTVMEQGVPGFTVSGWQGWFVAGGTPAPIVDRIRQEVAKIIAQPDMQDRIKAMGNDVIGSTPAEFDAYYRAEIAKYTKVIADANIPRQ